MNIELRPYQEKDMQWLQHWITGPELLFLYSGPDFNYPFDQKQMNDYRKKNPERQFYMGLQGSETVAFGEIIPQDHESVRLARLLVGSQKGKGIGTAFVKSLLSEAKNSYFVKRVDLFVVENNTAAIRCYKKAGFNFEETELIQIQDQDGKTHRILKMNHLLS